MPCTSWTPPPTLLSEDVLPASNRAKAVLTFSAAGVARSVQPTRERATAALIKILSQRRHSKYGNVKTYQGSYQSANDSQRLMHRAAAADSQW